MEEALREVLLGTSEIGLPATKVNFGIHPQGVAYPGIVLTVVDNTEGLTLEGADGLWSGEVQIDCYADEYGQAKRLSRAVINTLRDYSDAEFQGIFFRGSRDYGKTGGADRPFRVSLDFSTFWSA